MNKTVLTLTLLAGVYSTNMSVIFAGDPGEEQYGDKVSSAVERSSPKQTTASAGDKFSGVTKVRAKNVKSEVAEKVMTKEEAINIFTHYGSETLAGVASVAYMIAQPSHAVAVLVPWVAYGLPKMVISAVETCKRAYNDRLEKFKKAAFDVAVEAGVPSRFQKTIADNLMGRSEAYKKKFVELFSSVKRDGLSDYRNFSMAFAISTLREDRIGLVSELLKYFEDSGDVGFWYNVVEDAANSLRHRFPKGVCVDNEAAVTFIEAMATPKTN